MIMEHSSFCISKFVGKDGASTGLGIIDVTKMGDTGIYETGIENMWTVTRVNVPTEFRRQGVGTYLMEKLCVQADEMKINLELEVTPYVDSEMSIDDLAAFYSKFGFVATEWEKRIMVRKYI